DTNATLQGGSGTITCSGNWDSYDGTFTRETSTVVLTANGNLKGDSGYAGSFYKLTINDNVTTTLTAILYFVDGVLTMGNNSVLTTSSGSSIILWVGGATTPFSLQATSDLTGVSNITLWECYDSGVTLPANQNYPSIFLYDGTNDGETLLGGDVKINGTFSVQENGNGARYGLNLDGKNMEVTGDLSIGTTDDRVGYIRNNNATKSTLTVGGNFTIEDPDHGSENELQADNMTINVAGNWTNEGTFTSGTSTVNFNGSSTQTIAAGGTGTGTDDTTKDFDNLTVSGSTLQLTGSELEVDGTLTINASKILDLNGQDLDLNGTLDNSGMLQLDGSETVAIGTMDTDSGGVMYKGTADQTGLAAGNSYFDLRLNDGLVGYWKLDETAANSCSGGTNDACDSSGYNNDGAWINDATASTTVPDVNFVNPRSVTFDGTGDYVDVGNNTIFDFSDTSDFSISLWVNIGANDGTQFDVVIGKTDSATNGWNISLRNDLGGGSGSDFIASFWIRDGSDYIRTEGPNIVNDGTWHHLVAVYDSATDTGHLYFDGVVDDSDTNAAVGAFSEQSESIYIGKNNYLDRAINGFLDDVRIYNRALSATEIAALTSGGQPSAGAAT
ncbi:MAG: LamG domain-containing protein, partial [Gammaproteobacteria bacterium]|nr:LamG domain-containing protein [Gammaproteobacteria bacterium]